jgi:hypothetical protein
VIGDPCLQAIRNVSALLCANLAIRSSEPSYSEHSHGCSQEVQSFKER